MSSMDIPSSAATWAERKEWLEASYFVGRQGELAIIAQWYREEYKQLPILHLKGPAGSGKTSLMQAALRQAGREGFAVHALDCRSFMTAADLRSALNRLDLEAQQSEPPALVCFDHFEESGYWESWFRETWLPGLPVTVRILIAGRGGMEGAWQFQPVWKRSIRLLTLAPLTYRDTAAYAKRHGVTEERHIEKLWIISKGHPLTLSLSIEWLLASRPEGNVFEMDTFQHVLASWLQEVPDPETRRLLEAACVLRSFDYDKLTFLLGPQATIERFDQLLRLTFIAKCTDGWTVQASIRDGVRLALRARSQEQYLALERRAARYYRNQFLTPSSEPTPFRALGDLLYHTGNPLIRAHYHCSRTSPNSLVRVTATNMHELRSYLARRKAQSGSYRIACGENDTGQLFHYQLSQEDSRLGLPDEEELRELASCGAELMLVMKDDGLIAGFSAAVPLSDRARSYLQRNPFTCDYFGTAEWEEAKRCGGWFIRLIDIDNPEDEALRHDSFRLRMSYIQPGTIVIACPPPLPFYEDALLQLGFAQVLEVRHTGYGAERPSICYVLDLRGERQEAFLNKLAEWDDAQPIAFSSERLTKQEAKVASMLLQGHSNEEMAAMLFVSVITIKKHLSAIYRKTNVHNRVQFMAKQLHLS
ncbi:LuxR C-terminal-related transcriptional regulator [Paenibacillus sp. GCM10023248]|uniref:LuxR C-terminal-related transcriptional regulator n=1 Tax=unclassified Paenibacillus TaxID=185978 RepID=UPI002379E049|nr:LuxR C-terminal-related transcriptional regulator [Paenibacillus sp. MAHUQ-63]MDD9271648.1 LuxR C-terminal-related transcriptional regulator [Paenibacillus sp. MAHUQ-63]